MYKNRCLHPDYNVRTLQNKDYVQGRIQDFPFGGANPHWRGRQPPTQVLFGENKCKNKRIWSCWGGGELLHVDPPLMSDIRYYFARRGGENMVGMTKDIFKLMTDADTGMNYIKKVKDEEIKNHKNYNEDITTAFMSETKNNKMCPVQSYLVYFYSLNRESNCYRNRECFRCNGILIISKA